MTRLTTILSFVALACGIGVPARAQSRPWTDQGYVTINADLGVSAIDFSSVAHPIDFAETATVTTTYDVKSAQGFDVGAGVRVWRNLAIGADVSWLTKQSSGAVNAQIPHPLYFNRPRTVSGDALGLDHDETALHVQAVWIVPATARWSVALAAGPSWFIVGQDVVKDITIAQSYPFDTATYATAATEHVSKGRLGFNVGADVTYMLSPHAGFGFAATFSNARVPLTTSSGDTVTIDAGGAHVGGGLRVRF